VRAIAPVLCVVSLALFPLPTALSAASASSTWLDRYAATPSPTAAGHESLASVTSALKRDGVAWIAAKGASEANRRRLIAATFALDVAASRLVTEPRSVAPLVEWGCEQVRKRLPSSDERQWHVAALALLEGLGDPAAVEVHLAHAALRAAAEPRVTYARAWLADARTATVHPRQPVEATAPYPDTLVATWTAVAGTQELAGDAWVRVGFYQMLAGRHADARATLGRATLVSQDPDIRALAALFAAWCAVRAELPRDSAMASLRDALSAAPHNRTAAVWLARLLALSGDAAGAERVAERSLGTDAGSPDPWRLFYGGDFRRWPALVQALRKAIA
jgi:hypothetical protein